MATNYWGNYGKPNPIFTPPSTSTSSAASQQSSPSGGQSVAAATANAGSGGSSYLPSGGQSIVVDTGRESKVVTIGKEPVKAPVVEKKPVIPIELTPAQKYGTPQAYGAPADYKGTSSQYIDKVRAEASAELRKQYPSGINAPWGYNPTIRQPTVAQSSTAKKTETKDILQSAIAKKIAFLKQQQQQSFYQKQKIALDYSLIKKQIKEKRLKEIGSDIKKSVPRTIEEAKAVPKEGQEYAAATATVAIGGAIILAPIILPPVLGIVTKAGTETIGRVLPEQSGRVLPPSVGKILQLGSSAIAKTTGAISKAPLPVQIGLGFASSYAGTTIAGEAKKTTFTESQRKIIETEKEKIAALEDLATEEISKKGWIESGYGGIGGRSVPTFIPILGEEAKRQSNIFEGLVKKEYGDTEKAKTIIEYQQAKQGGLLVGTVVGSGFIELAGERIIGKSVLTTAGKEIGKMSLKQSFIVAGKQAPYFAGLGIVEGAGQEFGRQTSTGQKYNYLNIGLAGGFGAVSSTALGVPILGLGMAKGTASKGAGTILYGVASAFDISEPAGDILAGATTRGAKSGIKTFIPNISSMISPNSITATTQTQTTTKSSKSGSLVLLPNIVNVSQVQTTQQTNIQDTTDESQPIKDNIPPITVGENIFGGDNIFSPQNNNVYNDPFTQTTQENTQENINISSNITNNIPTNTWIPIVTAQNFKPLLPFGLGAGSSTQKGKGKMFYVGEAAIALGAFKNQMSFGVGGKTTKVNIKKELGITGKKTVKGKASNITTGLFSSGGLFGKKKR